MAPAGADPPAHFHQPLPGGRDEEERAYPLMAKSDTSVKPVKIILTKKCDKAR
jgi:hypothetical protein